MGFLGMLFITAGWILQYRSKSQNIERNFLLLYIAGAILMIFDNLTNAGLVIAGLSFVTVVIVGLMLFQKSSPRRRR